jgi:hypothetical protein
VGGWGCLGRHLTRPDARKRPPYIVSMNHNSAFKLVVPGLPLERFGRHHVPDRHDLRVASTIHELQGRSPARIENYRLHNPDTLRERRWVGVEAISDRNPASEIGPPGIGGAWLVYGFYSPRSSAGAKGLSMAPPAASGCASNHWAWVAMKEVHSGGTLSAG